MSEKLKQVFEKKIVHLQLDRLLPSRDSRPSDNSFGKFQSVLASVRELGLVEPIAVHRCKGKSEQFIVLDGHLRLRALKELGIETARCLVATEDDMFTYNDKANRLSCIQEHRMIMKAIDQGVRADEIAKTLGVNVERIRESMNILNGIHPDAVERLKDKPITPAALRHFRKVKPMRQMEFAELMVATDDYTSAYASALVIATQPEMLVQPDQAKGPKCLSADEIGQMEREMENLERDFRVYQDRYGENALSLNVIQRYVQRLLENPAVQRFLSKHYPEIQEELTVVAQMETL
jgi:ParB-like chromosome segregation protein Spo0J